MADASSPIHLDHENQQLDENEIQGVIDACTQVLLSESLCRQSGCALRVGVMEGVFHWHKHDHEDEFFQVVAGRFLIDLEREGGRTVELLSGQSFTIPKGVMHRPRAPERAVVLMVEGSSIKTGGE